MKKLIYLTLFLLTFISCSVNRTNYDYDNYTDYSQYKTYDFFSDAGNGLNDFDVKRVKNVIARQLNLKGMVHSDTPDVYVNFISNKNEIRNNTSMDIGIGDENFGIGLGNISLGSSVDIEQTVTIDLVEAKNNKLIWQGAIRSQIRDNLSPSQKESHFANITKKVFKNYPPKR